MKKTCKAFAAMALAAVLALCLGGCDIPMPGFADYDVSSYIQAYLDSSYHNANESIVALGHTTAQAAADNHATTVENAVVNFCNTYGLAFTEEQQASCGRCSRRFCSRPSIRCGRSRRWTPAIILK